MVRSGTEGITNAHLNLAQLKEISDNDTGFIVEILEIFKMNTPGILTSMDEAVANQDHQSLREAAHRYKSSINIMGSPELLQEVRQLEEEADKGMNMTSLGNKVSFIKAISIDLLRQVDEELNNLQS